MVKSSVVLLIASMIAAYAAPAADPSGTWRLEYDWEGTQVKDEIRLVLSEDGQAVTGALHRNGKFLTDIKNGKIDGDQLSMSVAGVTQGNDWVFHLKGKVSGDDIVDGTAKLEAGGRTMDLPWKPSRSVEMDDVVGTWALRLEAPGGQVMEPSVTITKSGSEYRGSYSGGQSAIDVTGLRVEKNKLFFAISAERGGNKYTGAYAGTPMGNKMAGTVDYDWSGNTGQLPFTAKRKSAE